MLIGLYILLYVGAEQGLWPLVAHFHHRDAGIPLWIDIAVNSLLIPVLIGALLRAAIPEHRAAGFPWGMLLGPLILMGATKYAADAFYPPFLIEVLTMLGASAIQACAIGLGWYVASQLHTRVNPNVRES